jgi:hypothetical protein
MERMLGKNEKKTKRTKEQIRTQHGRKFRQGLDSSDALNLLFSLDYKFVKSRKSNTEGREL